MLSNQLVIGHKDNSKESVCGYLWKTLSSLDTDIQLYHTVDCQI